MCFNIDQDLGVLLGYIKIRITDLSHHHRYLFYDLPVNIETPLNAL
jgi:hypothetical protein